MSPRSKKKTAQPGRTPSAREVLRPAELIGGAAAFAVFVGLVVLVATREPWLAGIGFGVAFIIVLVVLAMFVLGIKPDDAEKADIAEQDAAHGGTRPVLGREGEEHGRGH